MATVKARQAIVFIQYLFTSEYRNFVDIANISRKDAKGSLRIQALHLCKLCGFA